MESTSKREDLSLKGDQDSLVFLKSLGVRWSVQAAETWSFPWNFSFLAHQMFSIAMEAKSRPWLLSASMWSSWARSRNNCSMLRLTMIYIYKLRSKAIEFHIVCEKEQVKNTWWGDSLTDSSQRNHERLGRSIRPFRTLRVGIQSVRSFHHKILCLWWRQLFHSFRQVVVATFDTPSRRGSMEAK